MTVLHELAHSVPDKETKTQPGHDRYYCKTLLKFVRQWLGDDAWKTLKRCFKANKVKYSAERKKGSVSAKSLANLRPKKSTGVVKPPVVTVNDLMQQAEMLDMSLNVYFYGRWGRSYQLFTGNGPWRDRFVCEWTCKAEVEQGLKQFNGLSVNALAAKIQEVRANA